MASFHPRLLACVFGLMALASGALLTACIFDGNGKSDATSPPFLGQWKLHPDFTYSVRDSLYRREFLIVLEERGIVRDGEFVEEIPQALIDSFNSVFSCQAVQCDSILRTDKSYLIFTPDTLIRFYAQNESVTPVFGSAYRFDADSIYLILNPYWFDTTESGSPYRISANRDTLIVGDQLPEVYLRNSDPLPDYEFRRF